MLHDRRLPATRTAIDHLAVGPGGVYVIDARLSARTDRHRTAVGTPRDERRLLIGSHDQIKVVAKMRNQVTAIRRVLWETPIPVTAALCFVDAQPFLPDRPYILDGIWIGWADALPHLVGRPGLLDGEAMRETAELLDHRLSRS